MSAFDWLSQLILGHVLPVFANGSPYSPIALLGGLVFAFGWYIVQRRARGREISVKAFARALFPHKVLFHPSTWVDVKLWTLNTVVFSGGYAMLVVGSFFWRDRMLGLLQAAFGPSVAHQGHAPLALLISTVTELLAFELGYWFSHFLLHRVPTLWEFHKVHHSAEVMTTFTEMRQHPVEILLVMNLIAMMTGLDFGLMTYIFGKGVGHFTLLNGNLVLTIALISWGHLRHTNLWIPFRGLAGKLFHSPAHHQLHHSINPEHYDKNMGFLLSVWDWTFGTLHIPAKEREVEHIGVGAEYEDFSTVTRSFLRPFAKAGAGLRGAPSAEVVRGS